MFAELLSVAFPYVCLSCRRPVPEKNMLFCSRCAAEISPIGEILCSSCGTVLGESSCRCREGNIPLFSGFQYEEGPLRDAIAALKYEGVESAAKTLASLALPSFESEVCGKLPKGSILSFAPIPLHSSRERKRGYNQSELIAEELSMLLVKKNIPFFLSPGILKRTRDTRSQTEMTSHAERAENVRGCFEFLGPVPPKNAIVFLLDDVSTSGATIEEAARTLKKAGIPHVAGFSVAKA